MPVGPRTSFTFAIAARSASTSVTSHLRNKTSALDARAAPASSWMSTKATWDPFWAKARTMSAPIPLAPPVTKTTRPARLGYVAYWTILGPLDQALRARVEEAGTGHIDGELHLLA